MGSAMSMMEALGSKGLEGVMDFFFSMSLYNRHREIKSASVSSSTRTSQVVVDAIVGREVREGREGGEGVREKGRGGGGGRGGREVHV